MTKLRDQAVFLAAKGFRVFPLAPNSKIPALETDWKRIASSDPLTVQALWTDPILGWDQPYNIGVALDADVLVIDVDVRDGRKGRESLRLAEELADEPLPVTYRVRTPSRGDHYYFRVDGKVPFKTRLGENVDLKTLGGYVVGEGSVIDGWHYARADSAPDALADLPAEWAEVARRAAGATLTRRQSEVGAALVELDDESAIRRAVEWLRMAEPAVEGAGGDTHTFATAARVKDFGVSEATTLELLLDHWNDRCSPPWLPEDLKIKVRNAFNHGTSPIGIKAPEAEFEPVEVEDRRTKPKRGKLWFDRWEANEMPRKDTYLIEDWYDIGAMVVSYGESNAGKSNVVLSQAVAIATGQPWAGARTHQGLVVYVAAEGAKGFRKRIVAYRHKFGIEKAAFALVPCPVDLLRPNGDTKELIALIKDAESEFGQKCVMLVIDTLSRALAGGNENSPEDMGALVKHCDAIRAATGATLHIVHHSGKNQAAGARGHSLLKGATDTEIEIVGDRRGGTVNGTKQRDIERSLTVGFRYEVVELGHTDDGSKVTSVVTYVEKENEFNTRLPDVALQMHEVLRALQESDIADNVCKGIRWADWQEACFEHLTNKSGKQLKRTALFYPRQTLSNSGAIVKTEGNRWVAIDLSNVKTLSNELFD